VLRIVDSRQNTGYRGELLDASGRKVMGLAPGPNDVSRLAPGVYFFTEEDRGQAPGRTRKVLVLR
jgi:hypothetical protein